ncbi:hypothetical protein Poli38472_005063 [Pythium oligandrum]|uniref:RING-type domain-containing protein n=1 Tax=Pythium oligandrum TaxID=41045 RepID=A0A8K1FG72_PYTOL|nr:hypothetical protein Poli38472_005063 [Pythium oligandrum]|eukprot:TMW62445.1 hypothetical protein Poli38472_005063 [Pythium oligandrum]
MPATASFATHFRVNGALTVALYRLYAYSRNGSRRGSKKENYVEYEGGRMTRNGMSANHLLNFTLPERDRSVQIQKKKKNLPARTQMEYLHANYRFVVSPHADDTAIACWDIEKLTEWKSVEQVLLWYDESSPATCPICLDDFRAPKITRCGHIFCWPCILRYLSMTDKYWRRCPMCFDSVQKGQLRSVRMEKVQIPPHIDSLVTFQFLQRAKASFVPHIRDTTTRKRSRKLPTVYDDDAKYSRILESTTEYLLQLVTSEMRDLEALDAECRSCGDIDTLPFVEEAMRATSGRLAGVEAATAEGAKKGGKENDAAFDANDAYSFYQLANGSYVVLHPLNMRCLLKEYSVRETARKASMGSVEEDLTQATWNGASSPPASARFEGTVKQSELLPDSISGRVLDVEHVVMDDDVQKRYRFLTHLPNFCDFYVCEIDLSDQLSQETLDTFRADLKKREKQRRAKRDAEKKQSERKLEAPTSPIFKEYSLAGFSLDQGEEMWPAPAELSLSDAFQEGLQLSGEGDLSVSSPNGFNSSPVLSSSDEASFATITRNSGYFPVLGNAPTTSFTSSPSMWGSNPLTGAHHTPPPSGDSKLKKKGSMKKGTQLFSTNQRRSYR